LAAAGDRMKAADESDGWAFGSGGFAKLYGDRLAQSSLLDCDVATRWAFFFMLSQADAEGRYRCASVPGLARAAAITIEQAERAVAELEAPDPDSTTKAEDGRRLLRIPGGWQIVNFRRYREFRTERQRAEADKKRRQREALKKRLTELERFERKSQGGTCPGESPGHPHQKAEDRGQSKRKQPSATNGRRGGSDPSWSTKACEHWQQRFDGNVPGGRIGAALKPLVKAHGWPSVEAAWRRY